MTSQLKPATLATIFSEVLANLAFMFTEEPTDEGDLSTTWLETAISYDGPHRGTLRFRCTREFTVHLAANLLGADPNASEAEDGAADAVKELLNILCGQFVTSVHGTGEIYDLSIPEITEMSEIPDMGLVDTPKMCTLGVDGYRVQLVYESDGAGQG